MILQDIIKLDFAYLDSFSKRTDTTWGSLFCNESQPTYYDANHAHISETCDNSQLVIDEVVHYYETKKIIPRFYLYDLDNQRDFISTLKLNNFGYEELVSPVQLWDKKNLKIDKKEDVVIELVTTNNYIEALDIECSIKEFGGKTVREKAFELEFNHPNFVHFLLRYKGTACATACIFFHDNQARLESVATLASFRGRGLIGELIQYIQMEVTKRSMENLWVFPINETIEKVYQKYGFQTVEKLKMGHAFLGGKSIKEIQS